MTSLAKTFEPGPIEQRWYGHWESRGLFRPERRDCDPWTIVMPPPNVTGSLHIGHALDITLQDILTRHARMRGRDALWVVGTDHAGIATQMVVERNLASQGISRAEIGREAFLGHVWEWKAQSGGAITRQLRRLGASCDWANERFTMDEGFCRAVTKVFVELHRRGLAYRDKRLVNWDPQFQSAISDLEVETREVQGQFWHIRYPLADGSGHVGVATTRPETMLADLAVAVHPDDERYAKIVGKQVRLPITGRLVPVIADEHADPELGSGAVKITPGHDFNDFEVGRRAGFKPAEMLNMLDAQARLVQTADGLIPEELLGLDRFEARGRVVAMLEAEGALDRVEERVIPTPYGDRSGAVIEPWLTDQWYVNVKPLAEKVIAATKAGEIRIVPETWSKTWFHWLETIQPWCVSRQLWWGHRIPAWTAASVKPGNTRIYVGVDEVDSAQQAEKDAAGRKIIFEDSLEDAVAHYDMFDDDNYVLVRDPDVLDTWFSSALWPFATLGWPDETAELKRHYPNDVLISGFDILFFWDARMAMQGLEFMGEVPWRTLYLHGLVRDAAGQKMSKSKGNTVDPLGLIDRYGADALRFTLAAMESQGRDIKLDEKRVEGYRNFATKLWNAARFLQMNGVGASQSIAAPEAELPVNRWIIGEVVATLARLDRAFAELRFDEMADAIYHFTWGTFCDWYVELVKLLLQGPINVVGPGKGQALDWQQAEETRKVAAWAFDQILVMLHPFMPFITEELWAAMGNRPYELIVAKWPAPEASVDADAKAEIDRVIELISDVRAQRTEVQIPPGAKLQAAVLSDEANELPWLNRNISFITRLARLIPVQTEVHSIDVPGGILESEEPEEAHEFAMMGGIKRLWTSSIQIPSGGLVLSLNIEDLVDLDAERARLQKAFAAAEKERDSLAARLGNPAFTERAKPEAVEKARADHAERAAEAERLAAALARLG